LKIWRHLFGYLPVNVVSGLISFATVYAFTRLLGADDYGRYALVFVIMSTTHTLAFTWAESSAFRFSGEAMEKGGMEDHVRTTFMLSLISLLPAALILGAFGLIMHDEPKIQAALFWLLVSLPCFNFVQTSLEIHRAKMNVSRYAVIAMGKTVLCFVIGVLVAYFSNMGPSSPFIGLAVGGAFFSLFEGHYLWKISKGGKFQMDRAKRYFKYGMPLALVLVLELALGAGDRFLIQYFLGPESVGAYAAGYGVADQTIRLICMWGAMAGAPLLMAHYESHGSEGLKEAGLPMARMLMLLSFPATAGIAAVATPLSEFMIGEELREQAALIMPWIAVAGLLNGLSTYYFVEAYQLAHKTALSAAIMVIPVVVNIVLNIWLIPKFGIMGAVAATLLSYLIALTAIIAIGRRFAPLPFPIKDAFITGSASIAMALLVVQLPAIGGFPELILKAVVGAIVYSVLVYITNAANVRDLISDFRNGN